MDNYITVFKSYNAVNDGEYLPDWASVVQKLDNPVLLNITAEDYAKMKKEDGKKALTLKFKAGGYDAGACPLRHNPNTGKDQPSRAKGVPRPTEYNIVVLDADDNLPADFDQKLEAALTEAEYYSHATISSTEDKPRRRILIPLAKPINIDTREAFIRYLAEKLGMEAIDPASTRNKQMMCFPVHTSNGDKYHYHHKGTQIDAEAWLPTGWQEVQNWPRWAGEAVKEKKNRKRARVYYEDQGHWVPVPDKNKIHDAYNKTYRISDILKKHGYIQNDPNRWSHAGSCSGGIKVTNDSILYSYYGNDPLSIERDLDAYETALILEHGNIAEKDNWKAMQNEAMNDEAVRQTLRQALPVQLPPEAETWATIYDSTEEGIGKRCMAYYPHRIRNGKWWRYQNGIYKEVKDVAMLPDALQMIRIASALQPEDQGIQAMVGKVNSGRNVLKAWAGLATQTDGNEDEWEDQPWLLHFTDCVIDLKAWCKGEPYAREHSPELLLTNSTGHAWAEVEHVDQKALDEVIRNMEKYLPDKEIRDYFQKAMGRCLTSTAAAEDKCIWMMGPDGGNGKSTILNAVKGALGTYYYEMQGKYLYYNSKDRDAEAPSPELAGMRDKRFVNFCEYNGIRTLDPEKYKNYTSAGYIKARKLNSNSDAFRAKCGCFIDCNGMPGLQRREMAVLRRTRVIPFTAKLDGDSTVKNRWMTDPKIHVAMLVWLLLGLKAWWDNGCRLDKDLKDTPSAVYTETLAWINSFDDPQDFFEDFYEITHDQKDYLIADEAWETYTAQVYDKGASRHAFRQAEERWLRANGITQKGKRQINNYGLRRMCWIGVKLTGTYDSKYQTSGKWNHLDIVVNNDEEEEEAVQQQEEAPKAEQGGFKW